MKKNLFNSTLALFAALGMMFAGFSASNNNNFVQDSPVCEQNVQLEAGWLDKTFKKAVNSVEKDVKKVAKTVKSDVKGAAKTVEKGVRRIFH